MNLSAEEIKRAKRAYGEVYLCDNAKRSRWVNGMFVFNVLLQAGPAWDDWRRGMTWFPVFFCFFAAFTVFVLVFGAVRMKTFKARYADNVQLLDDLKAKGNGQLPAEVGVLPGQPLLDRWNNRKDKRPFLWRLDAFLSRKPAGS